MKRKNKFFIILFLIIVLIVSSTVYFIKRSEKELIVMQSETIETLDLTITDDGIYQGSYSAFPIEVVISVTVQNHMITQIELIKHTNGQGGPAEAIILDVIDAQSLDVELISGASYSSRIILLAIQDAIKK